MSRTLRWRAFWVLASFLILVTLGSCVNPFDPLDESEEIRGLSYVDFSLTWPDAGWDSDPGGDGVEVAPLYFNEFGDGLNFNDKAHQIIIEYYTEQEVVVGADPETEEETLKCTFDELIFSFPVEYENSDDIIRIPVEAYENALVAAGFDLSVDVSLFVTMRVFPPQDSPQPELIIFYCDQPVWVAPEIAPGTAEGLI